MKRLLLLILMGVVMVGCNESSKPPLADQKKQLVILMTGNVGFRYPQATSAKSGCKSWGGYECLKIYSNKTEIDRIPSNNILMVDFFDEGSMNEAYKGYSILTKRFHDENTPRP